MSDSLPRRLNRPASYSASRAAIHAGVTPAQRSIKPFDFAEPRLLSGALVTCSGLAIGGALTRRAANDSAMQLVAVDMTADAIAIQAALTDRRADSPRLIDEIRAFAHEWRADPKIRRRVLDRLRRATVVPFLRFF